MLETGQVLAVARADNDTVVSLPPYDQGSIASEHIWAIKVQ